MRVDMGVREFIIAAVVLASSTAPIPFRATESPGAKLTLAPDSGGVPIPVDVRNNLLFMRGTIAGSDSLWIVLDSGAGGDVMDAERAKGLGLTITGSADAHGAGGVVQGGMITEATVRLPGATLAGTPMQAIPLGAIAGPSGGTMDAIIGYPLLSRSTVRIDYAARTLTILDPATFRYSGTGTILPLTFDRHLPYVKARITVPGKRPIEGRFVIDSGSSNALILSESFVSKQHVLESVPKTIEVRGRGVGGQVQSRIGRIEGLELGKIQIDQPLATLRVSKTGTIAAENAIGNIGGEILRRFTVTFDYPRQRMILEPNERFADPFEGDMSGIGMRLGPVESKAILVEWVEPGSPAAQAGLAPDDLIEALDGAPVLSLGIPRMKELFRSDGKTYKLGVLRAGERLEIPITTRRMI